MTTKEYKAELERLEDYGVVYSSYDALRSEELKELRRDMRRLVKYEKAQVLHECGGRAAVVKSGDGKADLLVSYYTIVGEYIPETGEFKRCWYGYSRTTLKHVNVFRERYNLAPLSKREWVAMPVE